MSIDDLYLDFTQYAKRSETVLQEMLSLISAGKVPEENCVRDFNLTVEELRKRFDSVCNSAAEQLTPDEMPQENTASAYVEAVKSSLAVRLKKQNDAASACLERFIAVRSLVEAYTDALKPFQDKAVELLDNISSGSIASVEDITAQIAAPEAFLTAIDLENKDSEEGLLLCDRIGDLFSRRIQMGVAAGKYFTAEETQPPTLTHAADKPPTPIPNTSKNDRDKPESAFARKLSQGGAFIPSAASVLNIDIFTSPNESKKISASIFQNEVQNGTTEKAILKLIAQRDSLTLRYLTDVAKVRPNIATAGLSYLCERGYLRRYTVTPGGEFYCSTERLAKALSSAEVCKFLRVRRLAVAERGNPIGDTACCAAARLAFAELCLSCAKRFITQGAKSYTEAGFVQPASFWTKIYSSEKADYWELMIGTFWEDAAECDNFLSSFKNAVTSFNGLSVLTLAALNAKNAKGMLEALTDSIGHIPENTLVLFYNLPQNEYCVYPSFERIEEAEIAVKSGLAGQKNDEPDESGKGDKPDGDNENGKPDENSKDGTAALTPEIKEKLYGMLRERRFYAASAYLKALSLSEEELSKLYTLLAYALNDPMAHCSYSSSNAFSLMPLQNNIENYLIIAVALRVFFSNQVGFDNFVMPFYDSIKRSKLPSEYPALSSILYILSKFKHTQHKGMDAFADYRAKRRTALEKELANLKKDAVNFYDNFIAGPKKENASQERFLETKKLMFAESGDFGQYIKAMIDGESEMVTLASDFLQENFYSQDTAIEENTFDSELLWKYIVSFWKEAGAHMDLKFRSDLKSRLRTNITSVTEKAVRLLAKWINITDRLSSQEDSKGADEYKKAKKSLQENLSKMLDSIKAELNTTVDKAKNYTALEVASDEPEKCAEHETAPDETEKHTQPEMGEDERESPDERHAGLTVLEYALSELLQCINGTFREDRRKYYYMPFLLTEDILLDENFLPDLDVHASSLPALQPVQRILNHVHCVNISKQSYLERLSETFNKQGDDYGSASRMMEYLSVFNPETDLKHYCEQIEISKQYAKQAADLRKADFVGELELAQSYGQIDNSTVDKKEMILQIIGEWYEWAVDTSNFGFFRKVMDSYLCSIKESAKARENSLLEQLQKFKSDTVPGLTLEAQKARVAQIQTMIEAQNYTVAEDMLARFTIIEDDSEAISGEDFLEEFLSNYNDYYNPVAKNSASFSQLVSSRTRNKEERGGKRLADNWLPGGSPLGKVRLSNLLQALGFHVAIVEPQGKINNRFENFSVKTSLVEDGKRINLTHPIAPFGSGAAQNGFRVVCVNGAYDTDGLIDIMKQVGASKHTLILHDYALSKSERRRLARKTKNELGDKLFAVVDRTVMMFLVRNYDENKVNRMLMLLTVPFGYYQPYVWKAADVMPPEIFIGRKKELELIESASGVNIVYGGRQLGKSALLKKAREDIDKDENNDRAVYIEIKNMDYGKAANVIGHELLDQGILEKDIDTYDWDELARAIKRRLQSETAVRIPYLLLLLDEADAFIDSSEEVNYKPFDALKDIQSIGVGRFKFVVAGLRNVIRFKREAALGNNSVLTHLQSMTVKPFNTSEARELLEKPLYYLGLRFPKKEASLIALILATTNYFPGLIQLYCAKLLEAMRCSDYAGYDEVNTPVYEVSKNHIKKVLADPAFMEQIREKFDVTLKIGEQDKYYDQIALLLAYLYHNNGYTAGYAAADISKIGSELGIMQIASLEEVALRALLEELTELNILRHTDDTHYLFTRISFFQMMGTSAEVDEKLLAYMED